MNPTRTLHLILLSAIIFVFSCKKQNDTVDWNKDLKFQVDTIINITETTALIKGTITLSSKQQYISEYGVDYDTVATFANKESTQTNTNSSSVKSVPVSITVGNLIPNTKYYVRLWTLINPTQTGTDGDYTSSSTSFITLKFPLQLTSVAPDSGAYHDQFTIKGKGFSRTISDNQVSINGVAATVISACNDSLHVLVPKNCGSGTLSVKLGNETVNGPQFQYANEAYVVYTIAGGKTSGFVNGTGNIARFNYPRSLAIDDMENIFVADYYNHCIRKITSSGVVSTFAGSNQQGYANGSGTSALFYGPQGVLVDNSTGNILIAEYGNPDVRIVNSDASIVKTFAGCDTAGYVDNIGTKAKFVGLGGITQTPNGDFYVTEVSGGRIRKIDGFGQVTTFAGDGTTNVKAGVGTNASINGPQDITSDKNGNLYVVGYYNKTIFKIDPSKNVTLFSGSQSVHPYSFYNLMGIVAINQDSLLVLDNYCIKQISSSGQVTIFAGNSSERKIVDGGISKARFQNPAFITKDAYGNFYLIDDRCLRKIEKVN